MSRALFLFEWKPIDRSYLPGRGLAGSLVVHGLVLCALLFVSLPGTIAERSQIPEDIAYINLKDPNDTLYLPVLGGDAGRDSPSERSKPESVQPTVAAIPKPKGLSYPGPQPIDSEFPDPTNSILTVLQPTVVNPTILRPPLSLPNIVQMGAIPVPVPSALLAPQISAKPDVQLVVKAVDLPIKLAAPSVEVPKPALPVLAAANAVVPEVKPVPAVPPASLVAKIDAPSPPPIQPSAKPVEPLLVLTPMPAPRQEILSVPSGEARGRFSISPDPNLTASGNQPGTKADLPAAAGIAAKPAAASDNATSAPKDKVSPSSTADNTRGGRGGVTPGSGTGVASGISVGTNNNAFPGITILGGTSDTGTTKNSGNIISIGTPSPPLQTSYGVTVVSTEGSGGGGLPQFGVFSNDQIFTVYLDMRKAIGDPAPSWTFEYATLKHTTAQASVSTNPNASQQGIVLPFPIVKEQPLLPSELVRKYSRLRIIVYGVINTDGKMEQIAVKESPDSMLNAPVLIALSKWSFRPAQLDGETVPVKVLIGIPLS